MRRSVLLLVLLLAPCATHAAPPATDALTLSCPVCHGTGDDAGSIPSLADKPPGTIARALEEFRDGRRAGTAMPRLSKALTDDEIRALAEYWGAP